MVRKDQGCSPAIERAVCVQSGGRRGCHRTDVEVLGPKRAQNAKSRSDWQQRRRVPVQLVLVERSLYRLWRKKRAGGTGKERLWPRPQKQASIRAGIG